MVELTRRSSTHGNMVKVFLDANNETVSDPRKCLGGVRKVEIRLYNVQSRAKRERMTENIHTYKYMYMHLAHVQ